MKSKRECFDWKRKVCDLRPASVTAEINWTNEKLVPKRNGSETRQKCETVSKCKYEDIEKVVTERVPVQNCEDIQDTQQQCKNVPTAVPRVSKIYNITISSPHLYQGGRANQLRGSLHLRVLRSVPATL